MSNEPLTIETAGLSMYLPEGAVVVQGANTEGTVHRVVAADQAWVMEIQVRQTSNANATVHDVAELIGRNVQSLAPVVTPQRNGVGGRVEGAAELLQRLTAFQIQGLATPGERLYYAVPAPGSRKILGYTVLKPLPTTFVIFEFSCAEPVFAKSRAAYELSVATAKFEDPSRLLAARAAALSAGTEFLAGLTEERLTKVADGQERWFRWFRPAKGGTDPSRDGVEVGYKIVTASRGRRSDIGAESGGRDNPAGLVVRTQVRVLDRIGTKVSSVIDSDTRAFVSFDRKEEAWVTQTAVRDLRAGGAKPVVFSETGVRSGTSMSIVSRAPGKADSVTQPSIRLSQYASQAEVAVLGSLLATDGLEREVGVYAYRADTSTVSLRRERAYRDAGRGNALTVATRHRDEQAGTVSVYREDGGLVRSEMPDGTVWEPVEPESLLRLWKTKELPVK